MPPALSQGVRSHFGRRAALIFLEMSRQIQAKPHQVCVWGKGWGLKLGLWGAGGLGEAGRRRLALLVQAGGADDQGLGIN